MSKYNYPRLASLVCHNSTLFADLSYIVEGIDGNVTNRHTGSSLSQRGSLAKQRYQEDEVEAVSVGWRNNTRRYGIHKYQATQ